MGHIGNIQSYKVYNFIFVGEMMMVINLEDAKFIWKQGPRIDFAYLN